MDKTMDLIAELEMAREAGGYQNFVVVTEDDRPYEIIDVCWPGNHRPAELVIRPVNPS